MGLEGRRLSTDMNTQSREYTRLSSRILSKLVSAEYLEKSLSAGSKQRWREYKEMLARSRGVVKPLFDPRLKKVVLKYAYDAKEVRRVLKYLDGLKDEEGYRFSRDLKLYSKIEDSLLHFSEPDYTSFRWNRNYQSTLEELVTYFSKYKLKPLKFRCDDDIREALPKEKTHSGFYWILSGKKYKGENIEGSYSAFIYEKGLALESGSFDKPILLGFRTQASGEFEDDGAFTNVCKHKTRMVSMYDFISIINELQFSKPFQEIMAKEQFYAGGKDEHEISSVITGMRVRYGYYFSIDYSSFDSTISSWLIEDAFKIVKSAFEFECEEQERLFDIMVHDFIHKEFVLNEGNLICHRGVPSGSMFTQLIDTIVNLLVVRTFFKAMNQKAEMIIMGDDNCIFTNYNTSISNISTYISKNFGLIVKLDSKTSMGRTNDRKGIKFLSRYWRWDGAYRHPNQLISRMMYPERFRNYNDVVTPELVLYAFILTYGLGMAELIDCKRFLRDNPSLRKKTLFENVDSRYLPGSFAFIRDYTRKKELGPTSSEVA